MTVGEEPRPIPGVGLAAETIAAIASPPGRGALGIIRVSGAKVPQIAQHMLGALPTPRCACRQSFRDADGNALDDGIVLYFPAPASFTGEHVLELQGHGGTVVMDCVLERVLSLGARMARPGEFSERAFINGKLDLAQAEAVADLIDAGSREAARAAVRSLQGEFSARVGALQAQLTELRVYVEAAIDFPDEEIDFLTNENLQQHLIRIFTDFDSISAAARQGAVLREGYNVVISGEPNVGKSSLLNRLAGEDIAIVTDLPGTTRDVLRAQVYLDGVPMNFIDTAGLRAAADVVEKEGIRRARQEIERADRVLYVTEADPAAATGAGNKPPPPGSHRGRAPDIAPEVPVTWVVNKIDLAGLSPSIVSNDDNDDGTRIFLSAHTGAGLELLRDHLRDIAGCGASADSGGAFSARRRHLHALARAKEFVSTAAITLQRDRAFELFAEDLRLAQQALADITGEVSSDELLGEIFGSFCIGK